MAMGRKRKKFKDDRAYYELVRQTYNKYNQNGEALQDLIEIKVSKIMREILKEKKNIRVLSYGTDEVTFYLLNQLVICGQRACAGSEYHITYQIIDLYQNNIEQCRHVIETNGNYNQVKFEWFTGTFTAFLKEFRVKSTKIDKFDLVHCGQTLEDISWTIFLESTYKNLLIQNGLLVAIGTTLDSFWGKMMELLGKHNMEHDLFQSSGKISDEYFLSGWIELARNHNWKYHSYNRDYRFYTAPFYMYGSKERCELLDFVFHVKDAQNVLSDDIIEGFMNILRKHKVEDSKGNYFPCEFGAMLITKE